MVAWGTEARRSARNFTLFMSVVLQGLSCAGATADASVAHQFPAEQQYSPPLPRRIQEEAMCRDERRNWAPCPHPTGTPTPSPSMASPSLLVAGSAPSTAPTQGTQTQSPTMAWRQSPTVDPNLTSEETSVWTQAPVAAPTPMPGPAGPVSTPMETWHRTSSPTTEFVVEEMGQAYSTSQPPTMTPPVATPGPTSAPTASPTLRPPEVMPVFGGESSFPTTAAPTSMPTARPTNLVAMCRGPDGRWVPCPTPNPTAGLGTTPFPPQPPQSVTPTSSPTMSHMGNPSLSPTYPSNARFTAQPSPLPTFGPTFSETADTSRGSVPSQEPTALLMPGDTQGPMPSASPTATVAPGDTQGPVPTPSPTISVTPGDTQGLVPTRSPTAQLAPEGTQVPTPAQSPAAEPPPANTQSPMPTLIPTAELTSNHVQGPMPSPPPTAEPTPGEAQTTVPAPSPTPEPTSADTQGATQTLSPTAELTQGDTPASTPSSSPTAELTSSGTQGPWPSPTATETEAPGDTQGFLPTASPTADPTPDIVESTRVPTGSSTASPTEAPTARPQVNATPASDVPSAAPTLTPSQDVADMISRGTSIVPSVAPTFKPVVLQTTIKLEDANDFNEKSFIESVAQSSGVSADDIEVVDVIFKIETSYEFAAGTAITEEQAQMAIARASGVNESAVVVAFVVLSSPHMVRRLNGVQVSATISTSDSQAAKAAAAKSTDAAKFSTELSAITGTTIQTPEVVSLPTVEINVQSQVRSSSFMMFTPEPDEFAKIFGTKIGKPVTVEMEVIAQFPTFLPSATTEPTYWADEWMENETDEWDVNATPIFYLNVTTTFASATTTTTSAVLAVRLPGPASSSDMVVFAMKIEGVNYLHLAQSPGLLAGVKQALKDAVVAVSPAGVLPQHVYLKFSVGSLVVQVVITPRGSVSAASVRDELRFSTSLGPNVEAKLKAVPGIDMVSSGEIVVSDISDIRVQTSLAPAVPPTFRSDTSTFASPTPFATTTTTLGYTSTPLQGDPTTNVGFPDAAADVGASLHEALIDAQVTADEGSSVDAFLIASCAVGLLAVFVSYCCYRYFRDCCFWLDMHDPSLVLPDDPVRHRFGQLGKRDSYPNQLQGATPTPTRGGDTLGSHGKQRAAALPFTNFNQPDVRLTVFDRPLQPRMGWM